MALARLHRVRLRGLEDDAGARLNGRVGTLTEWSEARGGRWIVRLDGAPDGRRVGDEEHVAVRADRLVRVFCANYDARSAQIRSTTQQAQQVIDQTAIRLGMQFTVKMDCTLPEMLQHHVMMNGTTEEVRTDLLEGAPASTVSVDGDPMVCIAAERGRADAVRLLLKHGADAEARNSRGFTALQCSLRSELPSVARALLEGGVDVNNAGAGGDEPIHIACSVGGRADLLQLLLAHGADARRVSGQGKTPMQLAREADDDELIDILRHACAACGGLPTSGTKKCAGCRAVRYCSAACQKAHWETHRAMCRHVQG